MVERVRGKAATYGREEIAQGEGYGGTLPDRVAELYRNWVMPLTKDVQVAYLLRRLD